MATLKKAQKNSIEIFFFCEKFSMKNCPVVFSCILSESSNENKSITNFFFLNLFFIFEDFEKFKIFSKIFSIISGIAVDFSINSFDTKGKYIVDI